MISFAEENDSDFVPRIHDAFSEGGLLSRAKNFEFREEQRPMAASVARALSRNQHLIVEAGTGVGKSLAYLTPAVLWAKEHGRKAIISTYTINLQEQLVNKDLPLLSRILPVEFDVALWKGRSNYLCPMRLKRAMDQADGLFTSPERQILERLRDWSDRTEDGSRSTLGFEPDPRVWAEVCSEAHICTAKTCGNNPRCFYQQARKRLLEADVVVMNHTLFFLNATGRDTEEDSPGYLFRNDFVIFDEAHTIESIAARQIGMEVSQTGLRYALNRLYNRRTRKGLLQALMQPAAVKLTSEIEDKADTFFGTVQSRAQFSDRKREFRVRQPEFIEDTLTGFLADLQSEITRLVRQQENDAVKSELQDAGRRIRDAREGIASFLKLEHEDQVYWVEQTGKNQQSIALHAAPVDIAPYLKHLLFRPDNCCVMTSATLGTSTGSLDYFKNRVGAWDIDAHQIGSPFDYPNQMKVYAVSKMPDPKDESRYMAELTRQIRAFVDRTEGRAFVLFTNYRHMAEAASLLREELDDADYKLLVQGENLSREALVQEFKKDQRHVLFGTESFWSGVDVPGDALSNVIITRLPFSVPDHPLIEAKLEQLESRGEDPFSNYSLPEAILKFRQGVGRLIRTKTDRGIIVILDPRVLNRRYGKAFLEALPECPVEIL